MIINLKHYFMEKSQLERKIQQKVADMFSALEQELEVNFPESLKTQFSDNLCDEAEILFKTNSSLEAKKTPQKTLLHQDVVDKINKHIGDLIGIDAWNLKLEENLQDDLGYESLEKVELMISLEKEFGIQIDDEEFEEVETVEDVQILVLQKLGL